MNYYNLPKEIDLLILRIKTKAALEGITLVVTQAESLEKTTWYSTVNQIKAIVNILVLYQVSATDGDLQDLLDDLEIINWYNFLQKATKIKLAVELIETL